MHDAKLWSQLLGLMPPWQVQDIDLRLKEKKVVVSVRRRSNAPLSCPECGATCPGYDTRTRSWRHLDTMQYQTILTAEVPRVECKKHGVHQIAIPWAGPKSRFTALFETLAIDWLLEASISAVTRVLSLSWDEVAGIQERAVARGLARRVLEVPAALGVDETSFQKRREYVTVVSDLDDSAVLYVADGHGAKSLAGFYDALSSKQKDEIQLIAMDMSPAYISATRAAFDDADSRIVFDKFHVAKLFGDAVDKVRREEARALASQDDDRLKKTKYLWLKSWPDRRTRAWRAFDSLRNSNLKSARAWAIKETASQLWFYRDRRAAEKAWLRLIGWMQRSRLEPMTRLARTLQSHFHGIINAVQSGATNAAAESINSRIQSIKRKACGFRNRERFRHAIYFHLGRLDLYPRPS